MNLILLTFLATSLFFQKDGKEKKQLQNNAETAFSHADYASAKKAYNELFRKIDDPQDDWQNYVDIIVRYAEIHLLLKEYQEGSDLLLNLLKKNPPSELQPRIAVVLARLYSFQEQAGAGYVKMRQVTHLIPLEKWRPEERSFYRAVEYSLNAYYENLLQKAKLFSIASAYKESLSSYEELLIAIKQGYFPNAYKNSFIEKKIVFRLAECHFLSANFEKKLAVADSISPSEEEFDIEMLFLAARSYKEKREYEKALLSFQNYLVIDDDSLLCHYDSALFEIGQFYLRNGNKNKAKEYLEKLLTRKDNVRRPGLIGALSLGKIYLEEKKTDQAEALFIFVQKHLLTNDPLYFEATFRQGEAAFEQKYYQKAAQCFEKALIPNGAKGDWTKSALYKLAISYTRQNDETLMKKGEEILEKLLQNDANEEIALALADCYASQKKIAKMDELFTKMQSVLTEATKREFYLLQCGLKPSYEEKEALLQIVTSSLPNSISAPISQTIIAKGLYYQALIYLEQGLHSEGNNDFYFSKAINTLERTFKLVEKYDPQMASEVLPLDIKAHSLLKDHALALPLVKRLDAVSDNQKRLYLKALIFSQIDHADYNNLAAKKFVEAIAIEPNGEYADKALFALGMLHYKQGDFSKAKDIFYDLAEKYPTSPFSEIAYFWCAEAAEKKGETKEICLQLRTYQFERYPLSNKAPDAYFKCFSMEEYWQAGEKALAHIRAFPTLFPHSDLLAISYFFIGYHESSYPVAKEVLEKALERFNSKKNEDVFYELFRYRTMLKLALLEIDYAQDMSYALNMLLTIVSELQDSPKFLKEANPYPLIYEESEFALFQIYCNLKKKTLAYETLLSMLKHYNEAGITEGFYLSEVWKQQGILAFEAKNYSTAIMCFKVAIECGEKYLNHEQKLALLLHESHCYEAKCFAKTSSDK